MNPHYPAVARLAHHRCEYCRAPEAVFNFPFEVEHIIPLSREGVDEEENRALACRSCNLLKSAHLTGIDPLTGEITRLFHPRRDEWSDHFQVDPLTSKIIGKSTVGRASVNRLVMNSEAQLAARLQWMRLDMFP